MASDGGCCGTCGQILRPRPDRQGSRRRSGQRTGPDHPPTGADPRGGTWTCPRNRPHSDVDAGQRATPGRVWADVHRRHPPARRSGVQQARGCGRILGRCPPASAPAGRLPLDTVRGVDSAGRAAVKDIGVRKDAAPLVGAALTGPGRPLDSTTRSTMEGFFRWDLSHVRIHDGPAAGDSAAAVSAAAYTRGCGHCFRSRTLHARHDNRAEPVGP